MNIIFLCQSLDEMNQPTPKSSPLTRARPPAHASPRGSYTLIGSGISAQSAKSQVSSMIERERERCLRKPRSSDIPIHVHHEGLGL